MDALLDWIRATPASHFINDLPWAWPISETVHFIGLMLMTGTVGAFDLRMLGVGKGIAPSVMHRLIGFGMIGLAMSLVTGLLFISGAPDQYFYNAAFYFKMTCLFAMGCNVVLFYSLQYRPMLALGPNDDASPAAKAMALASLVLLAGVMLGGRMLTFFRPATIY